MKIIEKKSNTRRIKERIIIFNDSMPHIKSRASYILLKDFYYLQDEDFLKSSESLWQWLDFREKYLLERQKENNGNLICDYCGKEHLEIGGKKPEDLVKNNKNPNLATVDHIEALGNGENKYDKNNLAVSCKTCNKKKSNKPLVEFLKEIDNNKVSNYILKKIL